MLRSRSDLELELVAAHGHVVRVGGLKPDDVLGIRAPVQEKSQNEEISKRRFSKLNDKFKRIAKFEYRFLSQYARDRH